MLINKQQIDHEEDFASEFPSDDQARKSFLLPQLTRHEPLTRLTLISPNDFGGSGDSGGTFFN